MSCYHISQGYEGRPDDVFTFDYIHYSDGIEESEPFTLLISQICRRWRSIALNTRELWSQIRLADLSPSDRITLWLERAKNHSLHIFFDRFINEDDFSLAQSNWRTTQGLDLLEPKLSQCVDLTIHLEGQHIEDVLHAFRHATGPVRLRNLKLISKYRSGKLDSGDWEKEKMVEMVRDIRVFHLHDCCIHWKYPTFMTQLTELHLSEIDEKDWPDSGEMGAILHACSSLEYLGLNNVGLRAVANWESPITMPCLRTIGLAYPQWGVFTYLLRVIRAPALINLGIHARPYESSNHTQATLSEFVSSVSQTLRRLHLSFMQETLPPEKIEPLLRRLPHLTTLELTFILEPNYVLTALSTDEDLCPNLEYLCLTECGIRWSKSSCLLWNLVERRSAGERTRPLNRVRALQARGGGSPIVDVEFSWSKSDDEEEEQWEEEQGEERIGGEGGGEEREEREE